MQSTILGLFPSSVKKKSRTQITRVEFEPMTFAVRREFVPDVTRYSLLTQLAHTFGTCLVNKVWCIIRKRRIQQQAEPYSTKSPMIYLFLFLVIICIFHWGFIPGTFRSEDTAVSYAEFTADGTLSTSYSSISLAFRTREPNGLILFTRDASTDSFIAVELVNQQLQVNLKQNGNSHQISAGDGLSNGDYNNVMLSAQGTELTLKVNESSSSTLLTSGASEPGYSVFSVGGVSDFTSVPPPLAITTDTYFKGCLWDVKYNNYSLQFEPLSIPDVIIPTFPMTTNTSVLINGCESDDTCKDSPCENGGTCQITWNDFECLCPTGFGGKNCSELTICSENPCPDGAECLDLPDGHECK